MPQQSSSGSGNPHAGHRQRLRTQFLEHGLDTLSDVNVLELLLFYALPRQDTNLIAHRLLDTFGSLSGVFDAGTEDLVRLGGLTENTAALLKLVPAVARRHRIDRDAPGRILDTTRKCGERLVPFFLAETDETSYLLGLDGKCKELGCVRLSAGIPGLTGISIRRVVEAALSMKATSVVLAHNHPSGIAVPSRDDIEATASVSQALGLVGVTLADHMIVAGETFVSLAESGLMPRIP